MSWLRKMRPMLFVAGLAVGVGTLIGARTLTGGSSAEASGKTIDTGPRSGGGPVVLGTVDTDPPPVSYGLPPVLQSGTVSKVHVKDGDEVKADQPLYEFDSTIQKEDVKQAEAAVAYAKTKVAEAEELKKQHNSNLTLAQKVIDAAERKVELQRQHYKVVEESVKPYYDEKQRTQNLSEAQIRELKKTDPNLFKANVDYDTAVGDRDVAKHRLEQLKTVNPQVKVDEAEAAVKQAEAQLEKAKTAVELCIVRAKTAGTVEQVTIGAGTTMGISTRTPALWLIPAGSRVVRAEVEAEFAHRVGPNIEGKAVTISDHSDPKLTYTGTVRRIGTTFLLKRANAENFLGNDTRVLEVVIEVKDPSPAGKPPLRVGQRVRVNLGQ